MTKIWLLLVISLALGGCDKRIGDARRVVSNELGNPRSAEFRNMRAKNGKPIVCGEVLASDRPHGGWRHFVAYTELGRAAVMPSSAPLTEDAEMGNPLLKGAAGEFLNACEAD